MGVIYENIGKKQKENISLLSEFFIALNQKIIKKTGGTIGEVNKGNLDFSIWRALVETEKEKNKDESVITLAANLMMNIARSHPFKDGNKRTAYVAIKLILMVNTTTPLYLKVPYGDITIKFLKDIARGTKDIGELKSWIKKHSVKITETNTEVSQELTHFLDSFFNLFKGEK